MLKSRRMCSPLLSTRSSLLAHQYLRSIRCVPCVARRIRSLSLAGFMLSACHPFRRVRACGLGSFGPCAAPPQEGRTALALAASLGQVPLCAALIRAGASVDAGGGPAARAPSPLMAACAAGQVSSTDGQP